MKYNALIYICILSLISACSLAPDSEQIIGKWWLTEYSQYLINDSSNIDLQTNYAEAAHTEQIVEFTDTQIFQTDIESGTLIGFATNSYTLDPESKTLAFEYEYGSEKSYHYELSKKELRMAYTNYSSDQTNIEYKVYEKLEQDFTVQ